MKILVRNLDRTVPQAELLKLFQAYGTVDSCTLVMDEVTKKSKGFAFVEMPHGREAVKAIKGLGGVSKSMLKLNEAIIDIKEG